MPDLIFEKPPSPSDEPRRRRGNKSAYQDTLVALIDVPGEWVRITPKPIGHKKASDLKYHIASGKMRFLEGYDFEATASRVDPSLPFDSEQPNYYVYAKCKGKSEEKK